VSRCQKGKINLDFTEARDSEWHWHQLGHMQVCTSFQTDNHASTPPLKFFTAGRMPFLPPKQQRQSTAGKNQNNPCTGAVGVQLQPAAAGAADARRHRRNDTGRRRAEAPPGAAGARQHGRRHLAAVRPALLARQTAAANARHLGGAQTPGDGRRSAAAAWWACGGGRQGETGARVDGRRASSGGGDGGTQARQEIANVARRRNDARGIASPSVRRTTCSTF